MISKHVSFFSFLFGIIVSVAILHAAGIYFFLYWRIVSFDIIVHTLGGVWVGGMALWFYYLSGYMRPLLHDKSSIFLVSITTALIIGIIWEFFEIMIGSVSAKGDVYVLDTAIDLLADSTGAFLIAAYFNSKKLLLTANR